LFNANNVLQQCFEKMSRAGKDTETGSSVRQRQLNNNHNLAKGYEK
jgi:hypothetical protein